MVQGRRGEQPWKDTVFQGGEEQGPPGKQDTRRYKYGQRPTQPVLEAVPLTKGIQKPKTCDGEVTKDPSLLRTEGFPGMEDFQC